MLALVAGGITGDAVCGQQQTRPRQRIALNGFISHGTTGIPRWALNETALSGEPGDLIIMRVTAQPGERIEAGVYLFFKTLDKNDKPTGDWVGVTTSQRGIDWQYRSRAVGSVCSVVRLVNPSHTESDFDLPLFLPYAAIALPAGRYRFAYLIQVRANTVLVDKFWTDRFRIGCWSKRTRSSGVSYCVDRYRWPMSNSFSIAGDCRLNSTFPTRANPRTHEGQIVMGKATDGGINSRNRYDSGKSRLSG